MSITAKSVVLDIEDNWGTTLLAIRSVEFLLTGTVIPMTTGFTCYATNTLSGFVISDAFDTSVSKVGSYYNNSWASDITTDQRLTIVFDTPLEFDEIVINNSHNSGTDTGDGVNKVVITASDDAITSTVYDEAITTPTVLFDGWFQEHVAADVVDDQTYYGRAFWDNPSVNQTVSNGGIDLSGGTGAWRTAEALESQLESGKTYWEIKIDGLAAANIGFNYEPTADADTIIPGYSGPGISLQNNGTVSVYSPLGHSIPAGTTYADGDILGWAYDYDLASVWLYKNNVIVNTGGDAATGVNPSITGVPAQGLHPTVCITLGGPFTLQANTANQTYSPPAGFTVLDEYVYTPPVVPDWPIFDRFNVALGTSNSGRSITSTSGGWASGESMGIIPPAGTDFYFEVYLSTVGNNNNFIGVAKADISTVAMFCGQTSDGWAFFGANGTVYTNGTPSAYDVAWGVGTKIGVLLLDGDLYFSKEGVWQGVDDAGSPTGKVPAYTGIVDQVWPAISSHAAGTQFDGLFVADDILDSSHVPAGVQIGLVEDVGPVLVEMIAEMHQLYSLQGDSVYAELLQTYKLTHTAYAELLQKYHLSFVIELLQTYGDASVVVAELAQYYKDAPVVVAGLLQRYGAAGVVVAELLQKYEGPTLVTAGLKTVYNLLSDPVLAEQLQRYSLEDRDKLTAELLQPYSLSDKQLRYPSSVITVGGNHVAVGQWSLTYELGQYVGYVSLTLLRFSEWNVLDYGVPVVVTVAGTTYEFIITDLHKTETHEQTAYTVEARSRAVLLDFPYAAEITSNDKVYGKSSEIVNRIALEYGETVDWQLSVDPPQTESSYPISGKSPLGAIRDLIGELGGKLQSDPNGSLYARPFYEHNTNIYSTITPSYEFSTAESFTSLSTDHDKRDGFNKFEVSDDSTSDRYLLDSEQQSFGHVEIYATKAPWSSDPVTLRTSELSGVTISAKGRNTRQFTETIEIVSGEGNVDNNITTVDDIQYSNRVNLGNIEFTEGGKITVSSSEHTLLTVKYTNSYWLWDTYNQDSEEVQFILETQ